MKSPPPPDTSTAVVTCQAWPRVFEQNINLISVVSFDTWNSGNCGPGHYTSVSLAALPAQQTTSGARTAFVPLIQLVQHVAFNWIRCARIEAFSKTQWSGSSWKTHHLSAQCHNSLPPSQYCTCISYVCSGNITKSSRKHQMYPSNWFN